MPRLAIASQSLSPPLIPELIRLNPQFFDSDTQTLYLRQTTAGCQQNHVSIRLSTRDIFGTDIAADPRPIVDNHRSAKPGSRNNLTIRTKFCITHYTTNSTRGRHADQRQGCGHQRCRSRNQRDVCEIMEDEYVANALVSKKSFDGKVTPDLITSLCETL